jgi:chemosensory pili system protein ChpA (sensor histidine kinase/response regulator)
MSEVSTQTLHIVARELNNELNEARAALENFGEQQEDGRFLETCRDRLHSVNGALRVAEVYGAALLAEEMEQLSKYLVTNLAEKRHLAEGLDALMRAMVQLPTYLERVLNGGRDMALVLLPLLNDLRAVRGHALLSEGTLLLLNLTSEKQANPQPPAPGEVAMPVAQWARKLRTRYQLGLLGWIKGERVEQNLDALARAAEKLEQVATTQCVFQLWWVVGAVIEALRDRGLEGGASIKRLLGQADREMRRLYEQGEENYIDRPPVELLNNLLYYLARATSSGGRVSSVRASFRLGDLLPVDSNVEAARESLAAPSVKLMKTVAAAIKEDLAHVKDALDIFVRQGGTQATELAPQLELLRKIGDTLGVLGLGELRDKVQTEVAELQSAVQKQARIDEALLMRLASTLIKIEDGLDSELVGLILPGAETAAPTSGDIDFRQVSEAVLRECIVNMARVKEAIALSVERPREPQVLDQVPTLVSGIVSGLLMLGKTRAVEITQSIGKALDKHIRADGSHASQEAMERLADAIVAVEYYMETLQAGRADPWYMLDNAQACLQALSEIGTGATTQMRALRELDDHAATLVGDAQSSTMATTHQRTTLLTSTQQATQVIPTQQSAQIAAQAAAQKAGSADAGARKPIPPVLQPPPDKSDPEFLELFIEEARDEIAKLQRLFPLWDDNPQDLESLTNMRRSFHTLKGSGRMVGAKLIGEFAWAIENMLNRVINKTLDRSPDMMVVMRRAIAAVPELVEQLESGRPTQIDVPDLISEANTIAMLRDAPARSASDTARVPIISTSKPQAPARVESRPATRLQENSQDAPLPKPNISTAASRAAAEAENASGMDPILHEIFTKETTGHLAAIREYVASCAMLAPPYPVTESLHRACHTLSGTAKTAGARQGIKIAEPLNHYIRKLYDNAFGLPAAGLQVLKDSVRAIETVVEHINESTGYFVTHTSIIERIAKLERTLDDELTAMTAAVDVTQLTKAPGFREQIEDEEGDTVRRPVIRKGPPGDDHEIVELSFEAGGEDNSLGISSPTQLSKMLKFSDTQKISSGSHPPYTTEPPPQFEERAFEGSATQRLSPSGPPKSIVETAPWAARYEPPVLAPLKDKPTSKIDPPHARFADPSALNPDDEHAETNIEIALDAGGMPSLREPETISIVIPPRDLAPARTPTAPQKSVPQSAPPLRGVQAQRSAAPALASVPELTNSFVVPAAEFSESADEEWDPDVAAIFTEEATELLDVADASLASWVRDRRNQTLLFELKRALHTIKGGARMAGIRSMGDLSHELETFIEGVESGSTPAEQGALNVLQASLDELHRMRDAVSKGQKSPGARELIARIRGLSGHGVQEAPPEARPETRMTSAPVAKSSPPPRPMHVAPQPVSPPIPQRPVVELVSIPDVVAAHDEADADISADFHATDLPAAGPDPTLEPVIEIEADLSGEEIVLEDVAETPEAAPQPVAALPGREQQQQERQETARVDAELLDTLLNNAGEVSIFRSRLEQQVNSIEFNLAELSRTVTRLKDQLRKLELETEAQILHGHQDEKSGRADFDPLELDRYSSIQQLSRALAESVSDVASIEGLLEAMAREAQNLLLQQSRVVTEVQNGLMKTRMVPFQRHVQRLSRIVRQVASETGKRADLAVTGASGELDRQVLERMLPPFEHMLRNSVVHGIETPEERRAAGKPETGTIKIGLHREGSEMVIIVEDDGRGIDVKAVRARATQRGMLKPGRNLTDEEALQLVLEPGFSTASSVTQHAGRGVGMDVVVAEIKKLGGALFTASTPGHGVRFSIRLPFTLAISQALIVSVGDEQYALPLATVEGVARVDRAEVIKHLREEIPTYTYGNQIYRFQHLGSFIGAPTSTLPDADVAIPVMLIRAGEHSTGLVVDELVGNREIVVKSVGPQVSGIRGIAGATILGDGRIVVILDMGALVRSEWRGGASVTAPLEDRRTLALVVDDSITVRRVTQRLLERNGMRVLTAKDGVEALEIMQEHLPDIVLLDIEMPRMDGYELAGQMRNDTKLTEVPIIMITSRVGEKHRARAIELGVNDYLGKPYQENQLLDAIEPLVAARRRKQVKASR